VKPGPRVFLKIESATASERAAALRAKNSALAARSLAVADSIFKNTRGPGFTPPPEVGN